jgi:hypothetical protein
MVNSERVSLVSFSLIIKLHFLQEIHTLLQCRRGLDLLQVG